MTGLVMFVTEDTGEGGKNAVKVLLERVLGPPERRPDVCAPKAHYGRAANPSGWATAKNQVDGDRLRKDLIAEITTRVLRGQRVIFHYDGDRPWSRRSESERAQAFDRHWRVAVRQLGHSRNRPEIDAAVDRLVEMVPYYSIEAWLYAAVQKCMEVVEAHFKADDAVASVVLLQAWLQDPASLDEMAKPKEELCLSNGHNDALAHAVDLDALYLRGTSFREFVRRLEASGVPALGVTAPRM